MIIIYHVALLICCLVTGIRGWAEWDYRVTWANGGATAVYSAQLQWDAVWANSKYSGNPNPPRPRRGHSLHILQTDSRSSFYGGDTYIFLFGGRDNDQVTEQIPRTYNIQSVDGTLEFTTYDQRPVNPCDDFNHTYYSAAEQVGCNFTTAALTDIGLFYNDVWAYKLCNPSQRTFDGPCNDTGWIMVYAGASEGGCTIELGITVCTAPSERYNHGSVLFDDGTLYVYGGYSQRCTDYCDDLWFFDIYLKTWKQLYAAGTLTYFYNDTYFGQTVTINSTYVPITNTSAKFAGPSKRWRHTMVAGKSYYTYSSTNSSSSTSSSSTSSGGTWLQKMAIFGGHRLWHGFSEENTQSNNWDSYITRPIGGYLNDLWIYTKYLDDSYPGITYRAGNGLWELMTVKERCYSNPGLSYATRDDIACYTLRPTGRAGHGSIFDSDRNLIWIFGGYTTYYPYLNTDGEGSGPGVIALSTGGFVPFPSYAYFRNDLWYYNISEHLWY